MIRRSYWFAIAIVAIPSPTGAQTWATNDPILHRIWAMGMENSQLERIAQPLIDSIGPRLAGSPAHEQAHDWAVSLLRNWRIEARKEDMGLAPSIGWERGVTHVDLVQPRTRTLEGTLWGRSPGTHGPIDAPVMVVPEYTDYREYLQWLQTLTGSFVAVSFPEPTCRPDSHYEQYGISGALERLREARDEERREFYRRVPPPPFIWHQIAEAGAAGILMSAAYGDIGVYEVSAGDLSIPTLVLSCEDYGLVYRLARNRQGPLLRVDAQARSLPVSRVLNTVAEIRGTELPQEYVMLSAHMDSYDGASGATDNGAGVVAMLEAMRILRDAYPSPRRTIMLALWGSHEDGTIGSKRFIEEKPSIIENIQVLFNQDSGTGRVVQISGQGFPGIGTHLVRWLGHVPAEISGHVTLSLPGAPGDGLGSDYSQFVSAGAPGLDLFPATWSYIPTHAPHQP